MSERERANTAAALRCLSLDGWELQEPGWWTRDGVGGVCRERDRQWYAYPLEGPRRGPFSTMLQAMTSITFG